jgi:hypothetical protein
MRTEQSKRAKVLISGFEMNSWTVGEMISAVGLVLAKDGVLMASMKGTEPSYALTLEYHRLSSQVFKELSAREKSNRRRKEKEETAKSMSDVPMNIGLSELS